MRPIGWKFLGGALLVLFAIFGGACSRKQTDTVPPSKTMVQEFGTWSSPDKRLILTVVKSPSAQVLYTLSSSADGKELLADAIGSNMQRWCFYWDEQNRLWAYSSDTGYFKIITAQPNGPVLKTDVNKQSQLPKPIYDFLPSSLKKVWGI